MALAYRTRGLYTAPEVEWMTHAALYDKRPNRDQALLKIVAILTMMVDHAGVMFFPSVTFLRVIGRIAFPLFCWGIVVGLERTRDWKRYALRLLAFGVVSQPFFMLALSHSWMQFNVMATLLLGFLAIKGIRSKWHFSQVWGPVICLLIAAAFQMDYGWRGVLLIILMYLARDSRGGLSALMVAFCLYWGGGGSVIPRGIISALTVTPMPLFNRAMGELLGLFRLQSLAILSLPLMLIQTDSGLKVPKWISYAAYPGHLLLYWLLSLVI